jgi:hypothetical protein
MIIADSARLLPAVRALMPVAAGAACPTLVRRARSDADLALGSEVLANACAALYGQSGGINQKRRRLACACASENAATVATIERRDQACRYEKLNVSVESA